jgi:hypothetical protein
MSAGGASSSSGAPGGARPPAGAGPPEPPGAPLPPGQPQGGGGGAPVDLTALASQNERERLLKALQAAVTRRPDGMSVKVAYQPLFDVVRAHNIVPTPYAFRQFGAAFQAAYKGDNAVKAFVSRRSATS